MKYLSFSILGMMFLVTLGYVNAADELREADLRDEQVLLEASDLLVERGAPTAVLADQSR
jgi:hypothetical protein